MLSKFLIGQAVSAYTKNDHIFEGVVYKNSNNEKIVLNEDGKWKLLKDLRAIKQVDKKLNEENEKAIDSIIGKLSPAKVSQKSTEFEQLAKTVTDAAGFSPSDSNRKDLEKYAQEQLVGLKAGVDAKAGGNADAMDKAMKSLKDIEKSPEEEAAETEELTEAYNKNKDLLTKYKALKERRDLLGEDSEFDYIEDNEFDDEINLDDSEFEDDIYDDPESFDYSDEFTYDALEDDNIDLLVDNDFENALDEYEDLGGTYANEDMIYSLADTFGGDPKKALEETNSIPDAVCHLADQVKSLRRLQK